MRVAGRRRALHRRSERTRVLQRNRLAPARSRCTPTLVPRLAGVTPMMQQRRSPADRRVAPLPWY